MKNFSEKIENYYLNILTNLKEKGFDDDFYDLSSGDVLGLDFFADKLDLDIVLPKELSDILFNRLEWSYGKDYFVEYSGHYKNIVNNNNEIGNLGRKLINKYGLYVKDYPEKALGVEDAFKLSSAFFKEFDKSIYKYFKHLIDNNDIFVKTFMSRGIEGAYTLSLPTQKSNLILIDNTESILLASEIIHESMHAYINSFLFESNKNQRKKRDWNNLDEVITYFSELAFVKYLEDINYDIESINYLKWDSIYRMIYYTDKLGKYGNFSAKDIIYSYNTYSFVERLSYGTLLAFHYFDNYLKDENLDSIINFSIDVINKDKLFLLNNYGLDFTQVADFDNTDKILRRI